ncbi:MAG: O-methyltransferase [Acidimicrobiia bacterium]
MSRSGLAPELVDYLLAHSEPLPVAARRLIDETAAMGELAGLQISPEQGLLMRLLVRLTGARRILEIGTFTGLSSMMMALGGAERVVCLDVSEEWTAIARRYWAEAGVAEVIDLRLGPALKSLRAMDPAERFDLVFIDADKGSYLDYYQTTIPRLSTGGLIMVDNTLWSGRVIDPTDRSANTETIRRFNAMVAGDPRVEVVLLPIGDGLTLIRKL